MSNVANAQYGDYGMSQATARKRRLHTSLANQMAAFAGQRRGQRNLADINTSGIEGFRTAMQQYGQRGLAGPNVASGIQRSGLEQYASQLSTRRGDAMSNMQDELNRIGLDEANNNDLLDEYIKNLELQKQQQILAAASSLKQYGSY